jgi:hypothetical protein
VPKDRATEDIDGIAGAALSTMGILWVFVSLQTGKVSIRIAINLKLI